MASLLFTLSTFGFDTSSCDKAEGPFRGCIYVMYSTDEEIKTTESDSAVLIWGLESRYAGAVEAGSATNALNALNS